MAEPMARLSLYARAGPREGFLMRAAQMRERMRCVGLDAELRVSPGEAREKFFCRFKFLRVELHDVAYLGDRLRQSTVIVLRVALENYPRFRT